MTQPSIRIVYYCPHHPERHHLGPGTCPICLHDLVILEIVEDDLSKDEDDMGIVFSRSF